MSEEKTIKIEEVQLSSNQKIILTDGRIIDAGPDNWLKITIPSTSSSPPTSEVRTSSEPS